MTSQTLEHLRRHAQLGEIRNIAVSQGMKVYLLTSRFERDLRRLQVLCQHFSSPSGPISTLDDVLFPVEEHPVLVSIPGPSGERRLAVRDKKAIVNAADGRVLGIVTRGYRLVSNREALDWAFQCCRTVFPETRPGEWEVKRADAPGTGSHCFIDLVHNSAALDTSHGRSKDGPGPEYLAGSSVGHA